MLPNKMTNAAGEPIAESLLDRIVEERERIGARYMPTLTVKQFIEREGQLRELKELLVKDTDYGTIPGTPKPTLYQAGAQKICTFFGYAPSYTVEEIEDWDGARHGGEPLFYYKYTCTLTKDGKPVGQGTGSCNSWESKYRYRVSKRVCPDCGVPALIEGKQWKPTDPKQWVCYGKKGGCGAKFDFNDTRIAGQEIGRVANPEFADIINTVQKIAQKRAYVGACLSATGASQYFTQDIEDMPAEAIGKHDAPSPGSGSQSKPESAVVEDAELICYLNLATKSGAEADKVYREINDKIAKLSNRDTVNKEWAKAVGARDSSPTSIVRHMHSVLKGLEPPPNEDPSGGQQKPEQEELPL